ncbi:MAG: hypothetical protein RL413_1314 [Actinomycetota bacterium]
MRDRLRIIAAILSSPSLWPTALRVAWRLIPVRWWRTRPYLPLPSRSYLRFRLETYYGGETAHFAPEDVLKYLRWVREWD